MLKKEGDSGSLVHYCSLAQNTRSALDRCECFVYARESMLHCDPVAMTHNFTAIFLFQASSREYKLMSILWIFCHHVGLHPDTFSYFPATRLCSSPAGILSVANEGTLSVVPTSSASATVDVCSVPLPSSWADGWETVPSHPAYYTAADACLSYDALALTHVTRGKKRDTCVLLPRRRTSSHRFAGTCAAPYGNVAK